MLLDIDPEVYAASMNETELKSGDGLAEYSVTTNKLPAGTLHRIRCEIE